MVSNNSFAQVGLAIRSAGLVPRGALRLDEAERHGPLAECATIVLIGVAGRQGWSAFAGSPERLDGAPHPLDRWSQRVIGALAKALGCRALYPFGGPPYWPFPRWAMRAEPLHVSPLGMLIHPDYGLWHSYRGALAFSEALQIPALESRPSPCESCAARPCLKACPVGAFSSDGYDAARCAAHLRSGTGRDCMEGGCLARRACPIGVEFAQSEEQARFHMKAFLAAREGGG
ncbi:MAG TPA: hypothetical protein VKU03_16415 [Roseiarcus sp.]|nr:hypothetical protein [Roseiarcus sp.]